MSAMHNDFQVVPLHPSILMQVTHHADNTAGADVALSHKAVYSGLSGAIATTCIYPLDITKTKLQSNVGARISPLTMFTRIATNEGIRGLYRGYAPNVLLVIPEKAIKITANDAFRKLFRDARPMRDLPLHLEMAAGGLAGLCQVVATNPMELLKIQGATMNDKVLSGEIPAKIPYSTLLRTLGLTGLYCGVLSTLARDVPFSMIYFSLYAQSKDYLMRQQTTDQYSNVLPFIAGAIAGTTAAAITTPIDVIKTRVHRAARPQRIDFAQFWRREIDMIATTYHSTVTREGYRALLKGIVPRCLIISPLFAITMTAYEFMQTQFK